MPRRVARGLWDRVHEPRVINAMMALIYGLCFALGLWAVLDPPSSFTDPFANWMPYLWGGFLILGGAVGAWAAPTGKRFAERPALVAVSTGVTIYLTNVVTLHVIQPGNRGPQALSLAVVLAFFVMRWVRIQHFVYEPGRAPAVHE